MKPRPDLRIVSSAPPPTPPPHTPPEQVEMPFAVVNGEPISQLPVVAAVAATEALHGALGLGLEVGLAPVEMVEAPRGLAGELDVRHLVLTHRHVGRAVHQDVSTLQ